MKILTLLAFSIGITVLTFYGSRKSSRQPRVSKFAVLYPCLAAAYAGADSRVPISAVLSYGIANIGYMLLVAGVVAGRFSAFGLDRRLPTILVGLGCAVVGAVISTFALAGVVNG